MVVVLLQSTRGGDSYLDSRNRRREILGALSSDRVKSA